MKGLDNIGNTCYINASLQMLVLNEQLCSLVIKYSKSSQILKKISDFILEYHSTNTNPISPIEIKKIVEQKQEIFCGFGQQDSSEFIIYLLDIINEEIKNADPNSKGIEPIFEIKFNVKIKCKLRKCLEIYNKKEVNNFLLLDIYSNCKSLDDAYRMFKSSDKLESDNKYFCEKCNDKRIASKRSEICNWPQYLFVWLKRYTQEENYITKNIQPIIINKEWRYGNVLQGAVIHSGGLNSGHYIYVGKQSDGKWYIFNDSTISEIKSEQELDSMLSNAYWLCYKNSRTF
jgi:ubiquitin C-terminal hydrolase